MKIQDAGSAHTQLYMLLQPEDGMDGFIKLSIMCVFIPISPKECKGNVYNLPCRFIPKARYFSKKKTFKNKREKKVQTTGTQVAAGPRAANKTNHRRWVVAWSTWFAEPIEIRQLSSKVRPPFPAHTAVSSITGSSTFPLWDTTLNKTQNARAGTAPVGYLAVTCRHTAGFSII